METQLALIRRDIEEIHMPFMATARAAGGSSTKSKIS
jgi:hypothetical protein